MGKKAIVIFLLIVSGGVLWYILSPPHFNVEKLVITITQNNFKQLETLRNQAIEKGVLKRTKDDYVSCSINYLKSSIEGKVRLKGDWVDHLQDEKWSFRLKLEDTLQNGIQTFSLQNPKVRGSINGFIFSKLLRDNNVLSNEMTFVELIINGESWGIYNFEEHLSERMFRYQNRPEGLILSFEDSGFFEASMNNESLVGLIKKANIKVKGDKKHHKKRIKTAKKILENYQYQRDSMYKDFNIEAMARYYAICDLAKAYHAMGWINIRFYYNYETGLMEPIGYDPYPTMDWGLPYLGYQAAKYKGLKHQFDQEKIVYSALYNEYIRKQYVNDLIRIADSSYIEAFLERHQLEIDFFENELLKESSSYECDRHFLFDNARAIRKALTADGILPSH